MKDLIIKCFTLMFNFEISLIRSTKESDKSQFHQSFKGRLRRLLHNLDCVYCNYISRIHLPPSLARKHIAFGSVICHAFCTPPPHQYGYEFVSFYKVNISVKLYKIKNLLRLPFVIGFPFALLAKVMSIHFVCLSLDLTTSKVKIKGMRVKVQIQPK